MNTVESFLTTSPFNETEECAKFTISDASKVFMFSNIATVGQEYTFSTWIKSAKADELITEVLTEQTVEGFAEGVLADYEFAMSLEIPRLPSIDSICKVVWDGVEYTCQVHQFGEVVNQRYAGDPAIMGFTPDRGFAEGNGEPFCLQFVTSGDRYFISTIHTNDSATSHTIGISLVAESGAISIIIGGKEFVPTTSEWSRCEVTFKATSRNVPLRFGDIGVCYLYKSKLEIGNKVTDWTPAPEDFEMRMTKAEASIEQNADAISMRVTETDFSDRMVISESMIELLSDMIATLVRDENGESLMTQTADGGWTFSMAQYNDLTSTLSESVAELQNSTGSTDASVKILQDAVANLQKSTEYVRITTNNDEPCIELGESDSDFKLLITNTRIMFLRGSSVPTYIDTRGLVTQNITIDGELNHGNWMWIQRANGNYNLQWRDE